MTQHDDLLARSKANRLAADKLAREEAAADRLAAEETDRLWWAGAWQEAKDATAAADKAAWEQVRSDTHTGRLAS